MKKASSRKMAKKTPAVSVRPGRPSKGSADADADSLALALEHYVELIAEAERKKESELADLLRKERDSFSRTNYPPVEWTKWSKSWTHPKAKEYRRKLSRVRDSEGKHVPFAELDLARIGLCASMLTRAEQAENAEAVAKLERAKAKLCGEIGSWLFDQIAGFEAQKIDGLSKVVRHVKRQSFKFYFLHQDGTEPCGLLKAAGEGDPHAKTLVAFWRLWDERSTSGKVRDRRHLLPTKREIADKLGIERDGTFYRRLKRVGLDGLPAS